MINIFVLFRQELKGTGVRVVSILPGFVDTEGLRSSFSDEASIAVMDQYGYGDVESMRYRRLESDLMKVMPFLSKGKG